MRLISATREERERERDTDDGT